MRHCSLLAGLLLAILSFAHHSFAASAYAGFYVGGMYISFSGPITIPEYAAGPVAITIDADGNLTSSGDLSGIVAANGAITFNPGNVGGFTTGAIDSLGNLAATASTTSNGTTLTYRIGARNTPPGYGASGSLAGRILRNNPTQSIRNMNNVRFSGGQFIATGEKGAAAFSVDGLNWNQFGLPTTIDMSSIAHLSTETGDTYVAVGDSGALFYSIDAANWTSRGSNFNPIESVAAGNGIFVAVDFLGGIRTSPDGNVWTPGSSPIGGGLAGYPKIEFLNGKFVLANVQNVSFSDDGITWTPSVSHQAGIANSSVTASIAYGNGVYVAAGADGISYSPDGAAWTKAAAPTGAMDTIAFGHGTFVVQDLTDHLWASTDGINWEVVGYLNDVDTMAFGNGRFVAIGTDLFVSENGRLWENPEKDTMRGTEEYLGLSTSPGNGPSGYAPVLHTWSSSNFGTYWIGENGYIYYHLSDFNERFGLLPALTTATLRTIETADRVHRAIIAGDDGTLILIAAVAGNNAPVLTLLPPVTNADLLDGASTGLRTVLAGTGGTILVSANAQLDSWSVLPSGTTETLRQVVYYQKQTLSDPTPDMFIAVGDKGTLLTSPEGTAWTKVDLGTTVDLVGSSVIYPNSARARYFVAGADGSVWETSNGTEWTPRDPMPAPHRLFSYENTVARGDYGLAVSNAVPTTRGPDQLVFRMAYEGGASGAALGAALGNGRWVLVGSRFSAASFDGANWQSRPLTANFESVAYGEGRFVAAGDAGIMGTSFDGLHWTLSTNGPGNYFNAVAYGGGRFAAIGDNGVTYISEDGLAWTPKTIGTQHFYAITHGSGKFVAVGRGGDVQLSPDNGDSWVNAFTFAGELTGVAYGNGRFVAVGGEGRTSYSTDGESWTSKQLPLRNSTERRPHFLRVIFANGVFHATARDGELYTSEDGVEWTANFTGTGLGFRAVASGSGRILLAAEEIYSLLIENRGSPAITQQPVSVSAPVGSALNLSAAASGAGTLSYQWFKNGEPLQNGGRISGATSASLAISDGVLEDAGVYRLAVMNDAGSTSSLEAVVTIEAAPEIAAQPASLELVQNTGATFNVAATGPGPISYQWRKDGEPLEASATILGATSSSLTLLNVQPADDGVYDVVVTNPYGSVTSEGATLQVELLPTWPLITQEPSPTTRDKGQTITLTVVATGGQLQYTWFKDDQMVSGDRVSGQGTSTLTITDARGTDSGTYYVNVGNPIGFDQSLKVQVAVVGDIGLRQDFVSSNSGNVNDILRIGPDAFIIVGDPFITQASGPTIRKVARINGLGAVDPTFNGNDNTANSTINTIVPVADGKFVVGGGFSHWGSDSTIQDIARIDANGNIDTSFTSIAGLAVVKLINLAEGKLLAARSGSSSQNSTVNRYNADGTLDASFTELSNFRSVINGMAVQSDGTIWVSGGFGLKKLNADGTGATTVNNTTVGKIYIDVSDRIYYAQGLNLKRLNADGSPDNTFTVTANGLVTALAFLNEDRIAIGGDFRTVNGATFQKFALVNITDGTLVPDYASPYPSINGKLEVILPLGDGTVLAGGSLAPSPVMNGVQRIQVTLPPVVDNGQSYDEWLQGKAFTAGVNDGKHDDADSDGLSNAAEWAMGTDPLLAVPGEKPAATTVESGNETHAAIVFTRNTNADGASFEITASTSVGFETAETVTESVEDLGNGIERVTVRSTKPLSEVDALFFRVVVFPN